MMRKPTGFIKKAFLLIVLLMIFPVFTLAQGTGGQAVFVRIESVDTQAFPELLVRLAVSDDKGRSLTNMGAADFSLTEDGAAVQVNGVEAVAAQDVHMSIALALDISGSIDEQIDGIKRAAVRFVERLEPQDQVSLIYFGQTARVIEPLTLDRNLIINHINGLSTDMTEDFTALYDGAIEGVHSLSGQEEGRRVVVLMTDGKHTATTGTTLDEAREVSVTSGVPIYVVGVRSADLSEPELQQLSSNGQYYPVDQPSDLVNAFESVGRNLRYRYEVSFTSNFPSDGQTHQIAVVAKEPDLGPSSPATASFIAAPGTSPPTSPGGTPAAANPGTTVTTATMTVVSTPTTGITQVTSGITQVTSVASFVTPAEQETFKPEDEIKMEIALTSQNLSSIELFVDGQSVIKEPLLSTSTSWEYTWKPEDKLSEGDHTIEIRTTDQTGQVSTATQMFVVEEDAGNLMLWVVFLLFGLALLTTAAGVVFWFVNRSNTASSTSSTRRQRRP